MPDKFQADNILLAATAKLSQCGGVEQSMLPHGAGHFPSVEKLGDTIRLVKNIVFPDFLDKQRDSCAIRAHFIGVNVELLYSNLRREIAHALRYDTDRSEDDATEIGNILAAGFIEQLDQVKEILYTDVKAMFNSDPAVDNYAEVILSYPVIEAMLHYRVAHALLKLGVPIIPRMLTEMAHSSTGIDINPGAQIGRYFAIDHGTGVVIGQTCIIGDHVTLYQGVTLGAKNFTYNDEGHPVNVPRHPIIEDNVTIYSNASVLGRITVGHDSVIGGNIWLTESVPPFSRVLQNCAVKTRS